MDGKGCKPNTRFVMHCLQPKTLFIQQISGIHMNSEILAEPYKNKYGFLKFNKNGYAIQTYIITTNSNSDVAARRLKHSDVAARRLTCSCLLALLAWLGLLGLLHLLGLLSLRCLIVEWKEKGAKQKRAL